MSQHKSQQQHLAEAKRAINQGHSDYARRVIYALHARMDLAPPFRVNQDEGSQTVWCNDCSTGDDPVEADFYWTRWGSLCSICSLVRFDNDGENPRIGEDAERKGWGR